MVLSTIPFAVAAAFFPPALAVVLWLLATPPRLQRGLVYLLGAAVSTVGSGVVILAALHGIQEAPGATRTIEAVVEVVLGLGFMVAAVALVVGRGRLRLRLSGAPATRRRTTGLLGIFVLGLAMWTPSFAYVGALDLIAGSGLSALQQALNLLVVDVIILTPIELPLVLYRVSPTLVTSAIGRLEGVLRRYAWQIGSLSAGGGGIFLVVRGWMQLAA